VRKRILIALVVVLALAATASLVWANMGGLVSYWPFDEGMGTIAYNAVNGNDGTIHGGAAYSTDKAPVIDNDYALAFDGVDDYVHVLNSGALEPANVTLAAWLKSSSPGSPSSYRYIVHKGGKFCSAASYAFYTGGSGGLYFYIFNGSTYKLSPGPLASSIWNGEWHHVVGTYNGSAVRLYVDGAEIGSTPTTIGIGYGLPDTNDFFVGTYGGTCPTIATHFNGLIDEIGMWDRALSDDEIAALSVGVGSVGWLPPLVLEEWTLNENATLPIKFQLYGAYGNLLCTPLDTTLEVTGFDTLYPRFDPDPEGCYYIANFRPDRPADGLTATAYVDGVEVGVSREFEIVEAGTPNGRGRSNK